MSLTSVCKVAADVSRRTGTDASVSRTDGSDARRPEHHDSTVGLLYRSLLEEPHEVTHADGHYLHLSDGRIIFDGCGGAAVSCLGHSNEEVLSAMITQMKKVSYVHTASYVTAVAEELAQLVLSPRPGCPPHDLVKAYFVNGGSEINDATMKLARQYWFEQGQPQRRYYVSRRQAYHGCTIGAMSISSNLARKRPYEHLTLDNVAFVAPAYAYQYQAGDETEAEYGRRLVDELDAEFQRLGPANVISFTAEPVVGATSGCVPAPPGYFQSVRALCDKYGILLHLDEIMCGMGRMGTYFAFEREGIVPDLVTMGKGLGGGYAPIAALLMSRKVVAVLQKGTAAFNHGHTYQAHPTSCAAALAVQRIVLREGLVQRCAAMGTILHRLLLAALAECTYVGNVRGGGLFWGIEFVRDRKTKASFAPEVLFGVRVQKRAFRLGVAIYPGTGTVDGVRGDHVIIAPPFTVTEEELRRMVAVVRQAYDEIEAEVDEARSHQP